MGVVDWRAWTDQNGGQLPTAPNPPGTPFVTNQVFPGVLPIGVGAPLAAPGKGDLIDGTQSFPAYQNTPTTINAIDPYYVGTYPTGGGWMAQMHLTTYAGGVAYGAIPGGVNPGAGAGVPAGPIMRPPVLGITTP